MLQNVPSLCSGCLFVSFCVPFFCYRRNKITAPPALNRLRSRLSVHPYDSAPLPPDDDTVPFSKLAEDIDGSEEAAFEEPQHAIELLQSLNIPTQNTSKTK